MDRRRRVSRVVRESRQRERPLPRSATGGALPYLGEDGSFASYNQDGEQVDDGSYEGLGDRTFALTSPPVRVPVRYRIEGDTATFRVMVPPDCTTQKCRESLAYLISVFPPRTYKRVE